MNTILYIIQKEFRQIFRNKGMLPIIFVMPLIQLIILSNAATFEVKNIKFSYIDSDNSSFSRELIEKFEASTYFNVLAKYPSNKVANSAMLKGEIDVILEIPSNFERNLLKEKQTFIGVLNPYDNKDKINLSPYLYQQPEIWFRQAGTNRNRVHLGNG